MSFSTKTSPKVFHMHLHIGVSCKLPSKASCAPRLFHQPLWISVAFAGAQRRPLSTVSIRRMPCPLRARKADGGPRGLRHCMTYSKPEWLGLGVCCGPPDFWNNPGLYLRRSCLQDGQCCSHVADQKARDGEKLAGPLVLRPILLRWAFILIRSLYRAIKA